MLHGVYAVSRIGPHQLLVDPDQRIFLNVDWKQLEQIIAARGDSSGVRITYLEGVLELMSPSFSHESIKKTLARLLETYAEEAGITLNGVGSWTLRRKPKERAVEPDECYIIGPTKNRREPDLAIEVVWTRGGIDKLEVYCELGVREVWVWQEGALTLHALRKGGGYKVTTKSLFFPELDLRSLVALATAEDQTAAVRTFRAALRAPR